MNMTFRQLRLVLALADTGSISAAARATHVTQPTASMQLREAANAVGMPLYEVIGKRVHLTQAGKELARTARAMSAEWEAFEQKIDGLKGLTRGRLKVAVVSTAKYFVPRMLGSFCEKYPAIDISLEVLHRDGVEIFLFGGRGFGGVLFTGFGVDVADGRFLGLVFEHAGVPGHADFGWIAEVLRGSFQELRFLPENPHHQKESHQCGHKVRKGYFPCSAAVSSHDN
jgi:molybdenum-dependent DNA-binding transcriptional regulator ModE